MQLNKWRAVLVGWLALLTIGVVALAVWLARQPATVVATDSAGSNSQLIASDEQAETADLSILQARLTSLESQVQNLATQSSTPSQSAPATTVNVTSSASPPREFFVPLGNGSTTNRTWTSLTGAQVSFDPRRYQPIKKLYLEASGSIISGQMQVLLTDITNNRTYYEGVLTFNSSSPAWMRSAPLAPPPSTATLQLSILSSNGEMAVLNDSRLVVETGY